MLTTENLVIDAKFRSFGYARDGKVGVPNRFDLSST